MKFQRVLPLSTACAAVVTAAVTSVASAAVPATGALNQYNISAAYVSGVSSGGYMATQLDVAYSGTFKGAGIFAAGPYGCAQDNLTTALTACSGNSSSDNLPQLEQIAVSRSSQGTIDPISGLSAHRVWLYHGTNDSTVQQSVNDDLAAFYTHFGATVSYTKTSPAGHAWISPLGPNPCSTSYTPYLNNCGDDPEGAMLGHLLGGVHAPASTPVGSLNSFSQQPYVPGGADPSTISMGRTGFAYVPASCSGGSACTLMVALHGCQQGYDTIGGTFVNDAHLNEYADTNNIVVLYPQATPSSWFGGNPQGCWNWWGYLGDTRYDVHGGAQLQTIMNMVHALSGK